MDVINCSQPLGHQAPVELQEDNTIHVHVYQKTMDIIPLKSYNAKA